MKSRLLLLGLLIGILVAGLIACAGPQKEAGAPVPTKLKAADESQFAVNAFPPTIPKTESHRNVWKMHQWECLKCHGPEAGEAPTAKHEGMPEEVLSVRCRTCHVPEQ